MKEKIEQNVGVLVQLVIDYAVLLSAPVGKRAPIIVDLTQAEAVFEKAARKIDRSSPRKAPKCELEVVHLFATIHHLRGTLDTETATDLLCDAYLTVGHLSARLMRNLELSALGRAGGKKRHAPMAELRSWAIEKYKAGEWQSANQAAHALVDSVIKHGRSINAHLTAQNAQRTIAEWFRKSV